MCDPCVTPRRSDRLASSSATPLLGHNTLPFAMNCGPSSSHRSDVGPITNVNLERIGCVRYPFGHSDLHDIDNVDVLNYMYSIPDVDSNSLTGSNTLIDGDNIAQIFALLTHIFCASELHVRYIDPGYLRDLTDIQEDALHIISQILQKDQPDIQLIFLLVNESGRHWLIYIIDVRYKTIFYLDSLKVFRPDLDAKIFSILSSSISHINEYIFIRNHNFLIQKDSYSCGVYCIMFMERALFCLANDLPLTFDLDCSNMMDNRKRYVTALYHDEGCIVRVPLISSHETSNVRIAKEKVILKKANVVKTKCALAGRVIIPFNADLKEQYNIDIHDKIMSHMNASECPDCLENFFSVKFDQHVRCNICHKAYKKGAKSILSPTNDMDPGESVALFNDLSLFEKQLISPIHASFIVVHLKFGMLQSVGHSIFFNFDVNEIVRKLPNIKRNIVLVSHTRTDGKTQTMRVRREKVRQCLLFLISHNQYFRDIGIDVKSLEAIPLDGFGTPLNEIVDSDLTVDKVVLDDSIICERATNDSAFVNTEMTHTLADCTRIQLKSLDYPVASVRAVNEFDTPGLLNLSFPHLFPHGKAEYFNHAHRAVGKVSLRQYCKHLMQFRDDRFRNDLSFKFVMANMIYRYEIMRTARVTVNRTECIRNMNAAQLRCAIRNNEPEFVKKMNFYKRTIAGSSQFWLHERNKVEQACKQIGFPCFFVTLSCNDFYWSLLRELYSLDENDDLNKAVNHNPFPAVVFFDEKVKIFMTEFFPTVFDITAYHGRVEFQSRGAPHFHILCWVKSWTEIMSSDRIDPIAVTEFADRFLSATNPYRNVDKYPVASELCTKLPREIVDVVEHGARLLNCCARHTKCGKHCQREKNGKVECRFGYPKALCTKTTLLFPPPAFNMQVVIERDDDKVLTHNKFFLGCFNSNCDIQLICSKAKLFAYLLKYLSKPEKESDKAQRMFTLLSDTSVCNTTTLMTKAFMIMNRKEVSASECAMFLLGLPLVVASHGFDYVNTSGSRQINEEGFMPSSIDKYVARSIDLETLSMYAFYKTHYVCNNGKCIKRKANRTVILIPSPYIKSGTEDYYKQQCILHFAFRSINDIQPLQDSWHLKYESLTVKPYKIMHNFDQVDITDFQFDEVVPFMNERNPPELSKNIEDFLSILQHETATLESMLHDIGFEHYPEFDWNASSRLYDRTALDEVVKSISASKCDVSSERFNFVDIHTLNREQMKIYNYVSSHKNSECANKKQLFMIVQGSAGTGKSYLIKSLQHLLQDACMSVAFTGTAASLLQRGNTIHSAFSISIGQLVDLSKKVQDRLILSLEHIEYLFIDEFSMVSLQLLGKIDYRLRQIFPQKDRVDKLFAGINVIFFGDMYQLGCVKGTPIYRKTIKKPHKYTTAGKRAFSFFTTRAMLIQPVRQQGDNTFYDLLNRLKVGRLSREDYLRLSSMKFREDETTFNNQALRIYYFNSSCTRHNHVVMTGMQSNTNPVMISAADGKYRVNKNQPEIGAGPIQQKVRLCVGCRVTLRVNLSLPLKLTNGAFGTVKDILYFDSAIGPPSVPNYILVKFDNYNGPNINGCVPIVPCSYDSDDINVSYMKNIPLRPAFAVTVHAVQGATVDKLIVDMQGTEKSLGAAYVAISRVRRLTDIRISNLLTFKSLSDTNLKAELAEREREISLFGTGNIAQ